MNARSAVAEVSKPAVAQVSQAAQPPVQEPPTCGKHPIYPRQNVVTMPSKGIEGMKIRVLLGSVLLMGFIWFAGCTGDENAGKPGYNGTSGNNTQNNTNSTNAPPSLTGAIINHSVATGTNSPGTFTLELSGAPGATSGTYRLLGPSGTLDSSGTFTSVRTGDIITLTLQDSVSGAATTDELTFTTPTSGTFRRSVGAGSSDAGTFTLQ